MSEPKNPRFRFVREGLYFAECQTCDWRVDTGPIAARANDHARRNSHRVLAFRTHEYDFTLRTPEQETE